MDNFTWDIIGGTTDANTKRNTGLVDLITAETVFNTTVTEITTAFPSVRSLDIKTVRNLAVSLDAAGNNTVSFRIDTNVYCERKRPYGITS